MHRTRHRSISGKQKTATILRPRPDFLAISMALLFCLQSTAAQADDNTIAYQLFQQGRYAEAAEIFTDPAWKGAALYKSSQWWRAAEAFVRADAADSLFNMGNSYVQLGYYELALDAYLSALEKRPGFTDAEFNAELMRELLLSNQDGEATGLLQPGQEEIERLESEDDDPRTGTDGTESGEEETIDKKEGNDREGDTDDSAPTPNATAAGESDAAGSDKTPGTTDVEPGGSVKGSEAEPAQDQTPSGTSEGEISDTSDITAGIRSKLNTEQATDQWLNQINSDAVKYLKAQIALESHRRRAAGQAPPAGGSQW